MRKCYLCGAVLRRRAEFCRFCTAKQPDAASAPADRVAVGPSGAAPPPWLLPAPPPGTDDRRSASFQPTWEFVAEDRIEPPAEIVVERATARTDEPPTAFDDPVQARGRPHERPPVDTRVTADTPVETETSARTDRSRPRDPERTDNGRHPTDNGRHPTGNGTNRKHPSNGTNGHAVRSHTNGRTPTKANGNGHARNATGGSSRDADERRTITQTVLDPSDPLLGFEHFPDAGPAPEIRWG
jgi:hypothetical protein